MMIEVFYDNMDFLDEPAFVVDASLSMLPEVAGGRRVSAEFSFRPNHNFGGDNNRQFFIGQVDFGSTDLLPGETRDVTVTFLPVSGLAELLIPGRRWRIQEGTQLRGEAEVLDVRRA